MKVTEEEYKKVLNDIRKKNYQLYLINKRKLNNKVIKEDEINFINEIKKDNNIIDKIVNIIDNISYGFPSWIRSIISGGLSLGNNIIDIFKDELDPNTLNNIMNGINIIKHAFTLIPII